VSVKITGMKAVLEMLDHKKMAKVTRNTVNTTATAMRKFSFSEGVKEYNISAGRLKKTDSGKNTTWIKKARQNEDKATIYYSGQRPNIRSFSPNRAMVNREGGLKFKIENSDSLRVLNRGFFVAVGGNRFAGVRFAGTETGKRGRPIQKRAFTGARGISIQRMLEENVYDKMVIEKPIIFKTKFDIQMGKIFGRK